MTDSHPPAWAGHPDLLAYYQDHRSRPEHLYPSERRFLPALAARAESVLDVGCAAGGFAAIWGNYNPDIQYTGADVSGPLIETARRLHPAARFLEGNCLDGLPLPDGHSDVVQALGWLHWEPRHRDALHELWRLARKYLFFDVRLAAPGSGDREGRQRLALLGAWDGRTTVPYHVLDWARFAGELVNLGPRRILGHGYFHAPAEGVSDVPREVITAAFVLEKPRKDAPERGRLESYLDLPVPPPPALSAARPLPKDPAPLLA